MFGMLVAIAALNPTVVLYRVSLMPDMLFATLLLASLLLAERAANAILAAFVGFVAFTRLSGEFAFLPRPGAEYLTRAVESNPLFQRLYRTASRAVYKFDR